MVDVVLPRAVGADGTNGAPGASATVNIGTVTTLPPGSPATVENVGSPSNAVFSFGLPTGPQGTPGANGTNGTNGTAATITVGTVITGAPGSSATVTNVGTANAATFDFSIPRGADGSGSGDVVGPASATNNAVALFDGTTGKLLSNGPNIGVAAAGDLLRRSDGDARYATLSDTLNTQTGTTYTLQASDNGKVVELGNAAAITLTLPNSLAIGFNCLIRQTGAGQVTVTPASGANRRNRQSHTKLAGQWSEAALSVRTNAGGTTAEYVFSGDTAA